MNCYGDITKLTVTQFRLVGREGHGDCMGRQKRTENADLGEGYASGPASNPTTTSRPSRLRRGEVVLQRKYRELIKKHFRKVRARLFAEFTGLHFHITWAPPPPHPWETAKMPTACSVCCRLSGSRLLKDCRFCGPRQLARALSKDGEGHHFTCRLGVLNYWFRIQLRGETLGIAYLQALDRRPAPSTVQLHNDHRPRSRREYRRTLSHDQQDRDAKRMSWVDFSRAARLLQLIVQHVQTASLVDLDVAELSTAQQAIVALEKEQARLHQALQRRLPVPIQVTRRAGAESHPEQIVRRLLDSIAQDYARPLTLRSCAAQLGMNAAYLSALFSRAVGCSFKTYLTDVRMEKAKFLLSDAAKNVSEVAQAVGYASENRFRIAFKKASGLSPTIWRETLRMSQPSNA